MKITILGTGYVGLVSGICLAVKGHVVTCVDKNESIVKSLRCGKATIFENGIDNVLSSAIDQKNFFVTSDLNKALEGVEAVIIAVGTPYANGQIDLTYLLEASRQIGGYILNNDQYLTVIIKSTVIPGTTDTLVREEIEKISKKKLGEFGLGMNPEFLREGNAINDFMFPDRIVLGYEDNKTLSILEKIYAPWNSEKIKVNTRTAELIKYANNSLLATQISAINEIANFANKMGNINMQDVVKGIHLDKRWNPITNDKRLNPEILNYLKPGCGFGGSCFTKDIQAIKSQGEKLDLPMSIMNAVLDVNSNQPYRIIENIKKNVGELKQKKILILGLAFKPGTDDVRESPSLKIIKDLIKKEAKIYAHDPVATKNFIDSLGSISTKIEFIENWQTILNQIEIIILVTPWEEYFSLIDCKIDDKVIFDARRALPSDKISKAKYLSI